MTWYYADAGRQMGPVEDSVLDDLVRQGAVRDETLVWREGMSSWQALGTVRPRQAPPQPEPAPIPPPPAPIPSTPQQGAETRYCAECGRPYPAYQLNQVGAVAVCSTCQPVVMQRMSFLPPAAQPVMVGGRRYAGFWIRFVARVIDTILVGIVSSIILLPLTFMLGLSGAGLASARNPSDALAALPALVGFVGITSVLRLAFFAIYEIYFVTTRGATPGKMALGLKIIRADGGPIPAGLAAGRFFAQILSAIILYIGYIMAGFDPEKRSLHDRICDTRVIYAK